MDSKKKVILLFLLILIISTITLLLFLKVDFVGDERVHHRQINKFIKMDFRLVRSLTTIPGYNFIMALPGYFYGTYSLAEGRFLNLLFSLAAVIMFYFLAKKVNNDFAPLKTLEYYFFPILFPLFFFIYTDVMSLLFIFLALYFFIIKKENFAGFFGILSVLIRQNNIVWLVFLWVWSYYREYKWVITKENLVHHFKRTGIYLFGFVAFIVFAIINKGVVIGDKVSHPMFAFHLGNIYFILFLFFFLFLPLNIINFPKILQLIKKNKYLIVVIVLIILVAGLTFVVDHQYNQLSFWLRNRILLYFTSNLFLKFLFFVLVVYSILSLMVTKLQKRVYYLLYPFTILFLLPSWLIEQRYYLIPFCLFILFKKERSKTLEYFTILLYILLTGLLAFIIIQEFLFL